MVNKSRGQRIANRAYHYQILLETTSTQMDSGERMELYGNMMVILHLASWANEEQSPPPYCRNQAPKATPMGGSKATIWVKKENHTDLLAQNKHSIRQFNSYNPLPCPDWTMLIVCLSKLRESTKSTELPTLISRWIKLYARQKKHTTHPVEYSKLRLKLRILSYPTCLLINKT